MLDSFAPGAAYYELADVVLLEDVEERKNALERWRKRWTMRIECEYELDLDLVAKAKSENLDMRDLADTQVLQALWGSISQHKKALIAVERLTSIGKKNTESRKVVVQVVRGSPQVELPSEEDGE